MEKRKFYGLIKEKIRIENYAAEIGFTVLRKGRYLTLKEHDSVIIDPQKNCFWRNSIPGTGKSIGQGGSVIDFALEFTGQTLHEILKDFSTRVYNEVDYMPTFHKTEKKVAAEIQLPEKAADMRKVFAYLVKTRKIAPAVVQEFVDRKQLYQDTKNNCVFISYDLEDHKKVSFGCRRGTNTYFSFYGDLAGCDYEQCFYFDNGVDKLYITESVIDAMSIMTLLEDDWKKFNYLALAGVGKTGAVDRHLNNPKIKEIRIATDQDIGGRAAAEILEKLIRKRRPDIHVVFDLPGEEGEDWNSMLQKKY